MPGFDGTGPMGQGPMTGGARGFCVMPAEVTPGNVIYGAGRGGLPRGGGRGRAWGGGRGFGGAGFRRAFVPAAQPQANVLARLEALEAENARLREEVDRLSSAEAGGGQ